MAFDQTPSTTPKPKSNLWLIATIVLAVVLVVGSIVFAWQKSASNKVKSDLQSQINTLRNQVQQLTKIIPADETAGWKTYQNEQYGFEFKYPQNGEITTTGAQNAEICAEIKNTSSPYVETYWLCVFSAKPTQTLQDYITASDARFSSTLTVLDTHQIVIGQTPATQRTEQWLGTNENKNILETYIKRDGFVYSFHFGSTKDLSSSLLSDDKKTYDAILSTFKFTK